ncbi:MAG: protein adenylyltransferase SelO family protein, partial [bacterium]
VLRSSIREFLGSEAMIGLGIPSTRALCLYGSDDPVFRETTETAAIVTRLAPTFLRFGHVEFFAHFRHHDALNHFLRKLAKRHYPKALSARHDASGLNDDDLYKLALFKSIASRTGDLIARWQSVGFCHGVMNTDNM